MKEKATVITKETKTTKVKKPIDPKNKPVIPSKKQVTKATTADKKAATPKKSTAKKADVKKQEVAINAPTSQFSEADVARYDELVVKLRECWDVAQKATMATAFLLYEVYNSGLYKIDGHKNIYEFGLDMFGKKKTEVNRLINIVDRFGKQIAEGKPIEGIADKYSGYSQSQLGEMLGHSDDELSIISPEMSVREIREALKVYKPEKEKKEKDVVEDVADGSGAADNSDEQTEQKPIEERALLIWGFDKVSEWDNLLSPENELEYAGLLRTIRKCLENGHKVRILDVHETR